MILVIKCLFLIFSSKIFFVNFYLCICELIHSCVCFELYFLVQQYDINTIFENNESLSFRLTKQVWQAGDVAKLKIIITNNTNVNVSKITIKVGEFFSLSNTNLKYELVKILHRSSFSIVEALLNQYTCILLPYSFR